MPYSATYASDLIRDVYKQQEALLLAQLGDLVRDGILVIESTQPVLIQEKLLEGYTLRLETAVKLSYKGKERLDWYKSENERLKAELDHLKQYMSYYTPPLY